MGSAASFFSFESVCVSTWMGAWDVPFSPECATPLVPQVVWEGWSGRPRFRAREVTPNLVQKLDTGETASVFRFFCLCLCLFLSVCASFCSWKDEEPDIYGKFTGQ